MRNRMVVRLPGGELLKGFSLDFFPNKPCFHLQSVDSAGKVTGIRVIQIDQVDALFFVRDLAFDRNDRLPGPVDDDDPVPAPAGGRAMRVALGWGEVIEGLTYGYDPNRPGFFLYPTAPLDRVYNLERMYVTRRGIREVTPL